MAGDVKVIAAVFITLFGIAVGMSNGQVAMDDLPRFSDIMDFDNLGFDRARELGRSLVGSERQANTSLTAGFSSERKRIEWKFSDTVPRVVVEGEGLEMNLAGFEAGSEEVDVVLENYTGSLSFDGNVSLEGQVESLSVAPLQFSSDRPRDVSMLIKDPAYLHVRGVAGLDLSFKEVNGSFSSGTTTITLSGGPAVLEAFEGEFSRNFTADSYSLDGGVYRAVLGEGDSQTSIGAR